MKPTPSLLSTVLLTHSLHHASPLILSPSSRRQSKPVTRHPTALNAQSFAPNPWGGFFRFPDFKDIRQEDRDVSLLSLEGGSNERVVTWPNLLLAQKAPEKALNEQNDQLVSEMNSLTETFSTLQSSIDFKSTLYEETISAFQSKLQNLEEENAFLEEGMRMLTVTLEKQADEIEKLSHDNEVPLQKLQQENELLRLRVRGLEVELSDIAFESRKVVNPKPKAPSAPIPRHIQQQHKLEQLEMQLRVYEEERSSFSKLMGLCVKRGVSKIGKALDLWRPVYLLLVDARNSL